MLGEISQYKHLKEVTVMGEGVMQLDFAVGIKKCTLKITCSTANERDQLLENIKEYSLGRTFIHGYDPTIVETFQHAKHVMAHGSFGDKLSVIPHVMVDLMLKTT